ncbi:MAG: sigma 54-interacting transcriptional regulator [Longimicrobiaceae bacterium]
MKRKRPSTLGELKAAGYRRRPVKLEARENLIAKLRAGDTLFPGIVGYDDTVIPALANAVLGQHNFILLGLRGQAKSRILRELGTLLDEEIPVLAGSEVNDDPLAPISKYGRLLVEHEGDGAPIAWVSREQRYVEKLATPDVTVADLIGDMDPIRAARGGHLLSDELTIHFGLLPRANRGIFALNELPDLSGKVQVGLFNVLQEGDVQIKGYPVRLPLDLLLVFTANPEDYTARGKIITPLKDRLGAEVQTHYPREIGDGVAITRQEAGWERHGSRVRVPDFLAELIERVAFLARDDKRVDRRSGVSQRMPITALETAVSNAERRALAVGEDAVTLRVADVYAALPAITGKVELEYEGELQGAEKVARDLVAAAASEVFDRYFDLDDLDEVVAYFEEGGVLRVSDTSGAAAAWQGFQAVPGLSRAVKGSSLYQSRSPAVNVAVAELVLEGLAAHRRISRSQAGAFARTRPGPRKGMGPEGFGFGAGASG